MLSCASRGTVVVTSVRKCQNSSINVKLKAAYIHVKLRSGKKIMKVPAAVEEKRRNALVTEVRAARALHSDAAISTAT